MALQLVKILLYEAQFRCCGARQLCVVKRVVVICGKASASNLKLGMSIDEPETGLVCFVGAAGSKSNLLMTLCTCLFALMMAPLVSFDHCTMYGHSIKLKGRF